MSERTLQRRLREEGVTFAQLEDAVPRERAFRRWSGMASVSWQRAHAPPKG